jgi:isoleucyl-tRNA synthetase
MSFGATDPHLDLVALEQRVLERWRADDLPGRVQALRADGEPWVFYEGPPTANGRPGLHHVWARAFKDVFPRFQTMRGRSVPRKGGWDCHGLPVELEVEKALGLHAKDEIEAYGIAEFNARCRASVEQYVEDWTALTERSGVWIDTADAYWTLDDTYIESVWWGVKTMWDRGLLYEGHRVVPYCGRCGTALSSHEVAQGYRDVEDPSVYVRFPVTSGPAAVEGADLLVWTTTPWTLLSNTGAAVGAEIAYVRVAAGTGGLPAGRDLVMAAAAQTRRWPDATVTAHLDGASLVGARYQRPFDDVAAPDEGDGWRVVAGAFVSTDDGSGIVHLAPAFGEDDAAVGRAEGLPVLNPVDATASFDASVPRLAGRFVKDADRDLIADLDARGLLVAEVPYTHSYPHCWRCGTPLIYWAKTSWFARTSAVRDDLVAENETVNWYPEHIKHGRFGKWLEGNVDWALSRDRYWGTPLPIWRCEAGHDTCIGSVAELEAHTGHEMANIDLHRPAIDAVTFPCSHDGCDAIATRLTPVLDAWLDSGSMPTAQRHHPFDDPEGLAAAYPADFICEAIDQTRGWFYSLLAVNTMVLGSTPYRNVVCLGHIVDGDGQKMSKSKGNIIDPWEIFDSQGADALRWYFFSAGQPWAPRRVFPEGIREATRHTLLTLWNCVSFFTTYAALDGWTPGGAVDAPPAVDHVLDRWVLGELDRCVTQVTERLEDFDALGASDALGRFVDDLSNWYVRRSRPRFWSEADPAAHATLHHCLVVTAQLLAPFCPFLADEIWRICAAPVEGAADSVHLTDWPTASRSLDEPAASRMDAARRLVALGRSARTDAGVKVRQPLRRALLLHPGIELDDAVRGQIADELNVHELEDVDTLSGLLSWTVVPNFSALGPRLGKRVNAVKAALAAADGDALHDELQRTGAIVIDGETLSADEVELRATRHESFALAEDGGWAVALDLALDDELRSEGLARELTRALNEARKEIGLEISDRVRIAVSSDDQALLAALDAHRKRIANEVLALELTTVDSPAGPRSVQIGDATLHVAITVTTNGR